MKNKSLYLFGLVNTLTIVFMLFPFSSITGLNPKIFDIPTWLLLSFLSSFLLSDADKFKISQKVNTKFLLLTSSCIFINFFSHKYIEYYNFQLSSVDFAHFDYTVWNTIKGRILELSIGEDYLYYKNLLGNHFSPLLMLFSLFHFITESHIWLPFTQAFILAFSLIPLYKLANKYLNNIYYSFYFSLAFIYSKFFTRIIKYEFHLEIIYIPLLLIFFMSFDKLKKKFTSKSFTYFLISLILVLLVKEDSAIILSGLPIYYLIKSKGLKNKFISFSLLIASFLWLMATTKIIMPFFHKPNFPIDSSTYMMLWDKYGNNMKDIIITACLHPHWVLNDILTNKAFYYLFVPLLFIPFIKTTFLIFAPILGLHLIASLKIMKYLMIYYSAPILPLIFYVFLKNIKSTKMNLNIIKITIVLLLAFNIGGFKLKAYDKSYDGLNESIQRVPTAQFYNDEKIYVVGSVLTRLPYNYNFKRFSKMEMLENKNATFIVSKKGNNYPFNGEEINLIINKLRSSHKLIFQENDLYIFKY